MITINSITLTLASQSKHGLHEGLECYLILQTPHDYFFTTTTQLLNNVFQWALTPDTCPLIFRPEQSTLKLKLVHYETCRELINYQLTISEQLFINRNKSYEQNFTNSNVKAQVSIFFAEAQDRMQKFVEKTNNYDRFSKKTNTTHYQDSSLGPSIEKVSSLKQIVNSPRQWYKVSPSQTPKGEYGNMRSLRANLEKKLFASIQLQSKTNKRYII